MLTNLCFKNMAKYKFEGKNAPPENSLCSSGVFSVSLPKTGYIGRNISTPISSNISCSLEECQNLLLSLMQTVEGLLASCTTNVWNTYGGLSRLCMSVDKILCHGLIIHEGANDYWHFIQGLHWLKPELASLTFLEKSTSFSVSTNRSERKSKAKSWLKHCLENHILSPCLEALTDCQVHLLTCYEKTAYLCIKQYQNALIICLKAVEQNQPSLLAELNPSLIYHQSMIDAKSSVEAKSTTGAIVKGKHCDVHSVDANVNKNPPVKKISLLSSNDSCKNRKSVKKEGKHSRHSVSSSSSTTGNASEKSKRKCKNLETTTHNQVPFKERHLSKSSDTSESISSSVHSHLASVSSDSSRLHSVTSCLSEGSWGTYSNLSDSFSSITSVLTLSTHEISFKEENAGESKPYNKLLSLQRSKSDSILSLHRSFLNKRSDSFVSGSKIPKSVTFNASPPLDLSAKTSQAQTNKLNKATDTMLSDSSSALGTCSSLLLQVDEAEEAVKAQSQFSHPTSEATDSFYDSSCASEIQINGENTSVPAEVHGHKPSVETTKPTSGSSKKQHVRSQSDVICGSRSIMQDASFTKSDSLSGSLPSSKEGLNKRKSLIEGGTRVAATTECYFPKPEVGQSLTSFLSSKDFSDCAKLDRENAHFCISEALISAIEKIKCNQMLRKAEEEEDESDEEIQNLKQRIRIRRRERQEEKSRVRGITLLSDGFTDSTSTSQGASSPLSTAHSSSDQAGSSDSDDIDELELSDTGESKLALLKQNGLSLSMASLYSDADIARSNVPTTSQYPSDTVKSVPIDGSSSVSAETVALCLLKKFTEKQLPKASELMWLVSEQDAPQRLLPLPDSWPVSPDQVEEEYNVEKTRIRGSLDWAPPRAQVIFIIHPPPQRANLIAKQNYRCAGCGMKVDRGYIKRFRYCDYLGKYFCHCCHNNHLAYIPARILHKWDFTKYYVSNFAKEVLDLLYTDPLFSVADVNNSLYRRVKLLSQTKDLRNQLYFLNDYIKTCRHSKRLKEELGKLPHYWINEIHMYSIQDLTQVRSGELPDCLCHLVMKAVHHVTNCPLCQAKGFICEFCRKGNVIFPFQLKTVVRCNECGSCSHKSCFVPGKCPKCIRIKARKIANEQKANIAES